LRCKSKAQTFLINKKPYLTMDQYIGQLMLFAGNFAPRGWAFCHGQLLSIAQNSALFSLLGTTYGGDGQTTFGVPDLRGRAPIGMGQGPGLSNITQGEMAGAAAVTLTTAQMPAHSHPVTLAGAEVNINATLKGTITTANAKGSFPATTVPVTDGKVTIPVNSSPRNTDLFNPSEGVLAPTAAASYKAASNANYKENGSLVGAVAKIPEIPFALTVSGTVDVPINTKAPVVGTASAASAGGSQSVDIRSPYLGMNYCIAVEGIYPSRP
jgi:microcystin-dependent protein